MSNSSSLPSTFPKSPSVTVEEPVDAGLFSSAHYSDQLIRLTTEAETKPEMVIKMLLVVISLMLIYGLLVS